MDLTATDMKAFEVCAGPSTLRAAANEVLTVQQLARAGAKGASGAERGGAGGAEFTFILYARTSAADASGSLNYIRIGRSVATLSEVCFIELHSVSLGLVALLRRLRCVSLNCIRFHSDWARCHAVALVALVAPSPRVRLRRDMRVECAM